MLMKPSIIRMPAAAFPVVGEVRGCANSGYKFPDGSKCSGTFTCTGLSYRDNCIDSYSCGSDFTGGLLIGGATLYTAGIFIAGAAVIT